MGHPRLQPPDEFFLKRPWRQSSCMLLCTQPVNAGKMKEGSVVIIIIIIIKKMVSKWRSVSGGEAMTFVISILFFEVPHWEKTP